MSEIKRNQNNRHQFINVHHIKSNKNIKLTNNLLNLSNFNEQIESTDTTHSQYETAQSEQTTIAKTLPHDTKQPSLLDIVARKKKSNRKLVFLKCNLRLSHTFSSVTNSKQIIKTDHINNYCIKKKKNKKFNLIKNLYNECFKLNTLISEALNGNKNIIKNHFIDKDNKDDTLMDITTSLPSSYSNDVKNSTLFLTATSSFAIDTKSTISDSSITNDNSNSKQQDFTKAELFYSFSNCLNELKKQLFNMRKIQNSTLVNNQTNNNNDDKDVKSNFNTHQYFRNAQQLLSSNSSQMQNIFAKNADNFNESYKIQPYMHGKLQNMPENRNDLKCRLSNIQINQERVSNEKEYLPFQNQITNNIDDEATLKLIRDCNEKNRKPYVENSTLQIHRERYNQKKIEMQNNEYQKIRAHVDIIKNSSLTNYRNNFEESPEELNCNNRHSSTSESDTNSQNNDNEPISLKEKIDSINNSNINTPCIKSYKKVSFDNSTTTSSCNNNHAQCHSLPTNQNNLENLENCIKALTVTSNNLTRRMNNLEINFQEFSNLFIKLLEKSMNTQMLMNNHQS